MASSFVKFSSWVVSSCCCKLADLPVCPSLTFEDIDDDSGEPWVLLEALCSGQLHGWINYREGHSFWLLDVDTQATSFTCLVWNVLHQEYEVYVYLK